MKEMWPCLTVAAIAAAVAHGDVVRTVVPNTLDPNNPDHHVFYMGPPEWDRSGAFVYRTSDIFGAYLMDLDGNGTEDFRIEGRLTSAVCIRLHCAPGNAAWVSTVGFGTTLLIPLGPRTVVGDTVSGDWNSGVGWRNDPLDTLVSSYSDSLLIPPAPQLLSGGLFEFGTTAHAGMRFEVDGETHYGWVLINEVDPNPEDDPSFEPTGLVGAAFVVEYAYETEPDTPIVIPEPSTVGLLGVGALALWLRRRRPGNPLAFIH